jgi:hypothetical protein
MHVGTRRQANGTTLWLQGSFSMLTLCPKKKRRGEERKDKKEEEDMYISFFAWPVSFLRKRLLLLIFIPKLNFSGMPASSRQSRSERFVDLLLCSTLDRKCHHFHAQAASLCDDG